MSITPDLGRRRLLGAAAALAAAGRLGALGSVMREMACAGPLAGAGRDMPSLDGATAWLNSQPLTTAGLRGHVVLVDFWTYSCINWLRTLPYVRAWAAKYRDHGLVVIGVHSPEFGFEKRLDNVRRAVTQMRVDYAVAVDSDHAVWDAFRNDFWPNLYLVDAAGRIRYTHPGEGEYERSERLIQKLLAENGATGLPHDLAAVTGSDAEAPADWSRLRSPETYVGYGRGERFASPSGVAADATYDYREPSRLRLNDWGLAGGWRVGSESAVSAAPGARIVYRFHARDAHLVMGAASPGATIRYRVTIDGDPPGPAHGVDVGADGAGIVAEPRLYQLVRQPGSIEDRWLAIEFLEPGAQAFSFTFG